MPINPRKRKSPSPVSSPKRPRTIGPTLPPANLDERPAHPSQSADEREESSDDGDFGPALPSSGGKTVSYPDVTSVRAPELSSTTKPEPKIQRDEWMIVPPSSGDWSSRVDPTKLKNRRFNTGKSATGPSQSAGGESAKWTETPAEKAARLQREMMGIEEKSGPKSQPQTDVRAEATAKKLKEYSDKARGETLYAEHQRKNPSEEEDDPSARPFDREKDIAGGAQINHTQRKELLRKAADFGSKFSSGNYL